VTESGRRPLARRQEFATVENPPGIHRTTIAYCPQLMLCRFRLTKGTRIPLHGHEAAGYTMDRAVRTTRCASCFACSACSRVYSSLGMKSMSP